jgi:hypothetical protein
MMRLHDILLENPHFVPCPNGQHDPIIDMYSELLETDDQMAVANGLAAMVCPLCTGKMYWPLTFRNDPAPAPAGIPVVYWSLAKWNRWSPDDQQAALSRVPNLTRFLR